MFKKTLFRILFVLLCATIANVNMVQAQTRNIEGAVVKVISVFVDNGVSYTMTASGFMVGPNSVATAMHVAYPIGVVPTSISVTSNGHSVPVNSTQPYVDLVEWNQRITANGYGMLTEGGVDIAILKTSEAIGFQTGWFPLYDLDSGPVTVYGYSGGKFTVTSGGVLRDNQENTSWIPGIRAIQGNSGGLVMDTAGNAVGVAVMGTEKEVVAVDLSPAMIAKVQGFIAVNNSSIQAEITGRAYYDFAHRLAPTWAETNLSGLVAQLGGPNTATASAQIKATVVDGFMSVLPQVGAVAVVEAIVHAYGVELNPSDLTYWAGEMAAHPLQVIGLVAQATLPLIGAIPM